MFYMRIMFGMIRKSITSCALVSFALIGLLVNTSIADGDGFKSAEAETEIYWRGFALVAILLVGLLAVGLKGSKRSHQEESF